MNRAISSQGLLHCSLTCQCPSRASSTLQIDAKSFRSVSLLLPGKGIQGNLGFQQNSSRQQARMWRNAFLSFHIKHLKLSHSAGRFAWVAGKSTCAQMYSEESNVTEYSAQEDAAFSNFDSDGGKNGDSTLIRGLDSDVKGLDSALRRLNLGGKAGDSGSLGVDSAVEGSNSVLSGLDGVEKIGGGKLLQEALEGAAAVPGGPLLENGVPGLEVVRPEMLQGTKEWYELRKNRMTASSFGNSLGFWGVRRVELWEEKIGIRELFEGNTATKWGSSQEAAAIEKYKEITGNSLDHVAFKIYQAGDDYLSWLGASPDGLITYSDEEGEKTGEKLGILEVKCPHNKGNPELGSPWESVPHYYMPQAQGLLEIFDRKYMDFYVWTMNGSSVFRIERSPQYWGLMYRIMAEFWWGHVVPAKCALEQGKSIADIQVFRPAELSPSTERVVSMSRHLARNSRLIWRERMGHVQRFL